MLIPKGRLQPAQLWELYKFTKMEETNKKRGGKREGAGRKKTNHGKYYGFNSTPEVESILESLSKSKTEFINNAIISFAKENGII